MSQKENTWAIEKIIVNPIISLSICSEQNCVIFLLFVAVFAKQISYETFRGTCQHSFWQNDTTRSAATSDRKFLRL